MKRSHPAQGIRRRPEESSKADMRDAFSIDVDRILHSQAYTSYIDKTQVFYLVGHQGISHRVIHVQLLSRIARTIGRRLGLNDDLIEAIAIGHDIGHPPFGHDGERYLDELCVDAGIGPFRHNLQAIQALERIEKSGTGLNLTLQVLDGILCHNGEMTEQRVAPVRGETFKDFDLKMAAATKGEGTLPMTMEGCLVRVADTVSYIGRDIEDAISIGIISRDDIPGDVASVLGDTNGKIVYALVEDLIASSTSGGVLYSSGVFSALQRLKDFNYEKIYTNANVKRESSKIRDMYALVYSRLVEDVTEHDTTSPIFTGFLNRLGDRYRNTHNPFEMVRDYIAGLTDSAFLRIFHELFVPRMV
ncbi:MAG TPA: HD domain-containing protein [Deltaproteobacteria bacterium]|jgi:dGTPase|nr:HD domain-containing protein [Deltaproteobacteria bacterium]HRW80238.1 HD domain-containing protein [Desulfomonilia bacterium]NMD40150.1 HD domain-containing protein [Deltaproteobacteria bacterium]HNQ86289.1 HD domain-containing protein [Deltaproteobacteria bacterium]HNS90504.1 HD domain-containing protein [Deltaproteobacteria bacterium]